ncbi:MAG: MraY family glycosyltransferase [Bacteroidota bacterium]
MSNIVLSFLVFGLSYATTSIFVPEVIKIANRYDLQDVPDERKVHTEKIPRFGGIAMFAGFILTILVSALSELRPEIQYFLGGVVIIALIGIRDDLAPLEARWKFLGQIAAAIMVVQFSGLTIGSLNGLLGVYELPLYVDYPLTIFFIVGITNSINLIDGINGLAGSVSLVILSTLGLWFSFAGYGVLTMLCFSMVGTIIAFLRFNYTPAQIFMGDTGSLMLGFTISAILLFFFRENSAVAAIPSKEILHFPSAASTVLAVLLYPIFDTYRVFAIRIYAGRSPFSPDKNHIHHVLLRIGLSHTKATRSIVCYQIIFMLVFASLSHFGINENILLLIMITTLLVSMGLLIRYHDKKVTEAS